MRKIPFLFLCLVIAGNLWSQSVKIVESGKRVSIRGLSVVNDQVVWASGTGGNVARSVDGGASFTWIKVPG